MIFAQKSTLCQPSLKRLIISLFAIFVNLKHGQGFQTHFSERWSSADLVAAVEEVLELLLGLGVGRQRGALADRGQAAAAWL